MLRTIATLVVLSNSSMLWADSTATTPSAHDARQVIHSFASELKTTLITTMKNHGPVAAISTCNVAAPSITDGHSKEKYSISRTALKVRNPGNQPTEWQRNILKGFEQRLAAGEQMQNLEQVEKKQDGWYYIKAIGTGKPCLTCHGSELNPAVRAKLEELYPNDQATGFKQGDLRGAFIVKYQY